ncbi:MAG TPA: hypothetical protein VGO80_09510 [Solirubrobacteraceae bacterium]|nr:hypothetical protein [Solirubrobacteraceae bacterium]
MTVVKPQYGPTLPQLVRTMPRTSQAGVVALAVLLIAAVVLLAIRTRPDEKNEIVRAAPTPTFNLTYGPQLQRVSRPGAVFALLRERNGLFLDSYLVRPLELPPYRGAAGGMLPVYAVHYLERLRRRYGAFELAADGRTRINNAIGYQLVLRARRGGRTLYVRHLLLVPEQPEGARRGLLVELESTPAAGTPNAAGVGNAGPLKQAMRSLRFGTSREGGTQ